jgi:hypothetical protein
MDATTVAVDLAKNVIELELAVAMGRGASGYGQSSRLRYLDQIYSSVHTFEAQATPWVHAFEGAVGGR